MFDFFIFLLAACPNILTFLDLQKFQTFQIFWGHLQFYLVYYHNLFDYLDTFCISCNIISFLIIYLMGSLEIVLSAGPSICQSVRPSVFQYVRDCSLLFFEFLSGVNKGKKLLGSEFWKKSQMGKNILGAFLMFLAISLHPVGQIS